MSDAASPPEAGPAPHWTPDQPLRADATDAQIHQRDQDLTMLAYGSWRRSDCLPTIVREFATACVAEHHNPTRWKEDHRIAPLYRALLDALVLHGYPNGTSGAIADLSTLIEAAIDLGWLGGADQMAQQLAAPALPVGRTLPDRDALERLIDDILPAVDPYYVRKLVDAILSSLTGGPQ
jgi:hypothetical protein